MMLAALLLITGLQDSPPSSTGVQVGEFRFENFVSRQEGDEVIYIVSDMRFRNATTRLTGDYAVLWLDAAQYAKMFERGGESEKLHRGAMPPPSRGRILPAPPTLLLGPQSGGGEAPDYSLPADLVREIYVEGTVFFEQSEERLLQGTSLYMDLSSGRALIANGTLRTSKAGFHDTQIPLSVKAKWFRREATGRFVADEARYTTCSYAQPHQFMESDQIWIEETAAGTGIDAYRSTYEVENVPVFYLPRTVLDPETKDMIFLRGARVGSGSSTGLFIYTKWGHGFHALGEDFNEWILGERLPFKGDWTLRLDYRRKRGNGIGPEIEWETPGVYRGRLRAYYTRDFGEDIHFYPNEIVQAEGPRSRISFENRIWLDKSKEWTFDTELAYMSDPSFLAEYFRRDYFKDKEPETDAYLRWARNNQAFTALVKAPINDFDPVPQTGFLPPTGGPAFDPPAMKESLPELSHYWFREPLFALPLPAGTGDFATLPLAVYYTEKSSVGYLRRHPSSGIDFEPSTISFLPVDTMASARFDTTHELSAPFHAEPFILTPYMQERYTAYSSDLSGDETGRVIGAAGVRLATHLEGRFGEGWVHMVDPSIAYENTYAVTRDPSELISFDETDQITKNEVLVLALRNRVARRPLGDSRSPEKKSGASSSREQDWRYPVDVDLRLPVYLDPDRDNGGERYGDLLTDLYFESGIESGPLRRLRGIAELASAVRQPGPQIRRLDFAEIQLVTDPTDDISLFASHRRFRDLGTGAIVNAVLGGGFSYKIGEKWMFLAYENYNYELHKPESREFTMRRLWHDWVFEARTTFNEITGERIYSFDLQPMQVFKRGRHLGGISNFLRSSSVAGQQFYTD